MPNPFDVVSCFFRNPVSGFLGCFANPRTAFGFKRKGVFNPHLSGVIRSPAPIGALFCHPRRASRQICGFGLANTGASVPDLRSLGVVDSLVPMMLRSRSLNQANSKRTLEPGEGVIPYLIRSFFEREAISPIFDNSRRCRIGSCQSWVPYYFAVPKFFQDSLSLSWTQVIVKLFFSESRR